MMKFTVLIMLGALSAYASETILIHGHVYTGNPKAPWADAIAVSKASIEAVGSDADIAKHKEAKTKVIDLQGRTVIPGINDVHTHMWFGGLALRGFNIATPDLRITSDQPDLLIAKIKEYAAAHPKDKVLFGRAAFNASATSTATRQLLDKAVSDRPIVIHGTGEHNMWVNSKALEMAGVTDKPVADPLEEKYVVRDTQGHPTGILVDPAMQLIVRSLPPEPLEARMSMLRDAAKYLNSYGVTSAVNVTGNLVDMETYAALRDRGQLTIRTKNAFAEVSVNQHLTPKFLADLDKARKTYHDDWVNANIVKFFSDGAGPTSAQFAPGPDGTRASTWYTPEEFQKIVLELDKRGFQVVTHSIGDAASHMVLDAYEQVEKINGPRDRRLRMTHLFSPTADDVPRFAKLSVIPDMQPSFCCSSAQPNRSHPWKSLEESGAKLAFSSDWPCTWPPDPFVGIQQAVMRESGNNGRQSAAAPTSEAFTPAEAVTVEDAVKAYTQGGAYARFSEDKMGTLEPGKYADLVVLSQDIFTVAHNQIGRTHPVITMVGGKVVYEAR